MERIDSRPPFFPRSKNQHLQNESLKIQKNTQPSTLKRNSPERTQALRQTTADDARVSINEGVKDFAKIKKIADSTPEADNSDKIARLKEQINSGTYQIDYDAVADKLLQSEFPS